jgi:hypothetical protein
MCRLEVAVTATGQLGHLKRIAVGIEEGGERPRPHVHIPLHIEVLKADFHIWRFQPNPAPKDWVSLVPILFVIKARQASAGNGFKWEITLRVKLNRA